MTTATIPLQAPVEDTTEEFNLRRWATQMWETRGWRRGLLVIMLVLLSPLIVFIGYCCIGAGFVIAIGWVAKPFLWYKPQKEENNSD